MKNYLVAKTFYEIADMLDIKGEEFKPQAYRKVARYIESMPDDVETLCQKGELSKIPGVGASLKNKIEELLQNGVLEYHRNLKKELPVDLDDLLSIEGVGPKMVKIFYEELGIKTIKDLERAIHRGDLKKLPHCGEKIEQKILLGIKFFKKSEGRFLLGFILPLARNILAILKEHSQCVEVAGSIRRNKETVGDIDIVAVASNPEKITEIFVSMPEVEDIESRGLTRSSVRLQNGIGADLRVVELESFGSALQYFTGNKEHNIALRKIALNKNLKLNEYGVFKKDAAGFKKIAGRSEKEVYEVLGLSYIEPELREMRGEIEAAQNNSLPRLIKYGNLKGDLHTHTTWSEGNATIEQMAQRARERGMSYIAITDHAGMLKVANAMDETRLLRQIKEIDKINKEFAKKSEYGQTFRILKGAEVDINKNGGLDIKDEVLAQLDIVVASVHSDFKMSKPEMTQRIIAAMQNPYMNILAHPTGRIIRRREAYELDHEAIYKIAKERNIALEINSFPERLDLRDEDIHEAISHGAKLVISSDSHSLDHLPLIEFGIATARRGWAENKDIINTLSVDKLLNWFDKKDLTNKTESPHK